MLRKLLKWIILAYFAKHLTQHALIVCAFGRKTKTIGKFSENLKIFDENAIETLNFFFFLFIFYFFKNLLLKIEPSKITPFLYNNSFRFGAAEFPPSPGLSPWFDGFCESTRQHRISYIKFKREASVIVQMQIFHLIL